MPSLRKKKSKKAKPAVADPPVSVPSPQQSAANQSPHASPHPSTDASPRESPFKRLLRRSTSSLGDSWRGLKNRRRESVSSVLGGTPAAGMSAGDEQGMTPSRSRGSEVSNASPNPGQASTSRSGSIRGSTTPLHPRPGSSANKESPNTTHHHHHRAPSSISSLTTFPNPNPATPVKASGGTAAVRESNVASVETIASSSHQPPAPENHPLPRGGSQQDRGAGMSGPDETGRDVGSLGLDFTNARDDLHATSYTAPLTPPTPPSKPPTLPETQAPRESPALQEPETQREQHTPRDHDDVYRAPVLAPALAPPISLGDRQQQQQAPEPQPRSSYIRPHPAVHGTGSTTSPLVTDVFGTVGIPSAGRASEGAPRMDVAHAMALPVTADWVTTPPTTVAELDTVAQLEKGDATVKVKEVGASVSNEKRMRTGDEGVQDQEPKTSGSPRLGSFGGIPLAETHVGTPHAGVQDLEMKPPSSPRLGMGGSTLEETYAPTGGHGHEQTSKPPSSPRLKPIGIIPDIPVPEEPFIPGILGLRPDQQIHIIHALEPVLEETPKATEIERFAGLPYLDDTKHRRDKGKGKAVDQGTGGVVAVRTSGHKKLHMFEGGNPTKARLATTTPPHSPSFDPGPSTPPLTHKPLDRTTYPPAPPTPPRIRWEIQRHPNRAQHTEHAAIDPPPYAGGLHEAGAGGLGFTRHGEVWIGRPPASLNSVALRALALEERERERARGRETMVRRQSGRQLNTQVVTPTIIITPPASPTTNASRTTAPPPTQPPMLPFIPRIFAPRLNLDFQWADTWLPSDVVLEAADPAVPTVSISLYESIRNWTGLAASAPTRRIANNMDN